MTKTRMRWVAIIGVSLAIAAGAAAVGVFASTSQTPESAPSAIDLNGNAVTFDPGVTPPPGADAVSDIGTRFEVPSVKLDVPLGSLSEVDGEITPPGFTSVYLVRNRGQNLDDASKGTVYAVTHSLRGGGSAPGNYLFDPKTKSSTAEVGASIKVGDVTYTVSESRLVDKTALPLESELWENVPNRLVLITCMQKTDGSPSSQNLIIVGTRDTAAG